MADSNIIAADFGAGSAKKPAGEPGYDYDRQCDLMRERNRRYLDLFEADMRAAGLAESTIRRHLDNVGFYINVYLLHYDVNEMEYGCHDVYGFLGDFFIRKCAWSTPGTIKTNAASIKKFYKCMCENGLVSVDAYDELVRTIKENMPDWQDACAEFNDPSNDPFLDGDDFELDPDDLEPPSYEQVVEMFTLTLFYLTSWQERVGGKGGPVVRRAWKSADWDALDALREQGMISCTNKAKSVTVTDAGAAHAGMFLHALGLGHLVDD